MFHTRVYKCYLNRNFVKLLQIQLQCFWNCFPYFENFYKDSVFLLRILNANFHFYRISFEWVSTLQALLKGLLIIENCQKNLHILGTCRRMLDEILAGFQLPTAKIRLFYQILLFLGIFHRL